MIDIQAIKEALPHRYPMLLVDRVLETSEDTIVAIKNVTINEPFFNGHFPSYPVMPGVLIMEALAQTAGVLELSKPENKGKLVFYAGMDKVKFKKTSRSGRSARNDGYLCQTSWFDCGRGSKSRSRWEISC